MEFIDLKTQYKRIEASVKVRLEKILQNCNFIMGPEVEELEEKLALFCGVKHCIACSSGTDALLLALMAYGVGPEDAIFTSPFTFVATAEVISLLGATPVWVDIDAKTFNIDPILLEESIKNLKTGKMPTSKYPEKLNPRGIIAVDLFGLPADYDAINKIAKTHNMFVLEDAAQSFGGMYKGKMTCNLTDIAATSFFPSKPLGCYGDGGAVFTNDPRLAATIRSLRVHGQGASKYDNLRIGINGRLDTIQAAILLSKMEIFADEMQRRQEIAHKYSEGLKDFVETPFVPDDYRSAWAQYSVLSEQKNELIEKLKAAAIPTAVYYPKPLHLQAAFAYLGYTSESMKRSEMISKKIFSLPMHPYLTEADLEKIINVIGSIHML